MNKSNASEPRPIRKWGCHKLECFGDYIEAYTAALGKERHCYLELYASGGQCSCKGTDCIIEDSALRALSTQRHFDRHVLIAHDPDDAESLAWLMTQRNGDVKIVTGNCVKERVLKEAFDLVPRSASSLALIDPPGYRQLRWSTIRKLAAHGQDWKGHKVELLILFPLEMALLRNLTRPECQSSITRLYGHRDWQELSQKRLAGKISLEKMRDKLVRLFKAGLKGLGYKYVEDFKPASPSSHPLYHVISANDSQRRAKMMAEAWGKARYLPCELLYDKKDR
ncbi:MAG: three-Cys-motif partner protein TcmP [Dehalococcoidia bacterium]|jgi:three-Cys-motif partner protein